MKKLTKTKIKAMIKAENKAKKEYKKYGLKLISKDEGSHAKMLKRKLKMCKKKSYKK